MKKVYISNLTQEEREVLWVKLNSDGELDHVFSYMENFAASLADPTKTKKVFHEDYKDLLKWYGKLELAISKLENAEKYSKEFIQGYIDRYEKVVELSGHIAQRSIAD